MFMDADKIIVLKFLINIRLMNFLNCQINQISDKQSFVFIAIICLDCFSDHSLSPFQAPAVHKTCTTNI